MDDEDTNSLSNYQMASLPKSTSSNKNELRSDSEKIFSPYDDTPSVDPSKFSIEMTGVTNITSQDIYPESTNFTLDTQQLLNTYLIEEQQEANTAHNNRSSLVEPSMASVCSTLKSTTEYSRNSVDSKARSDEIFENIQSFKSNLLDNNSLSCSEAQILSIGRTESINLSIKSEVCTCDNISLPGSAGRILESRVSALERSGERTKSPCPTCVNNFEFKEQNQLLKDKIANLEDNIKKLKIASRKSEQDFQKKIEELHRENTDTIVQSQIPGRAPRMLESLHIESLCKHNSPKKSPKFANTNAGHTIGISPKLKERQRYVSENLKKSNDLIQQYHRRRSSIDTSQFLLKKAILQKQLLQKSNQNNNSSHLTVHESLHLKKSKSNPNSKMASLDRKSLLQIDSSNYSINNYTSSPNNRRKTTTSKKYDHSLGYSSTTFLKLERKESPANSRVQSPDASFLNMSKQQQQQRDKNQDLTVSFDRTISDIKYQLNYLNNSNSEIDGSKLSNEFEIAGKSGKERRKDKNEKESVLLHNLRNLTKYNTDDGHTIFRYFWYDFLPVYTGARSAVLSKYLIYDDSGDAGGEYYIANYAYLFFRILVFIIVWSLACYNYYIKQKSFWQEEDTNDQNYINRERNNGDNFMYVENWFMGFYMIFTLLSLLTLLEFQIFNWPHGLPTIPNHIVHSKKYWKNKDITVNFRRDAAVVMKWANIFFELACTFGFLSLIYWGFDSYGNRANGNFASEWRKQSKKICDYYESDHTSSSMGEPHFRDSADQLQFYDYDVDIYMVINQYSVDADYYNNDGEKTLAKRELTISPKTPLDQEINWIITKFQWIRYIACILIPLELIISSYRIQFWHIWIPIGIYFLYLAQAFNLVKDYKRDHPFCYLKNTYPGLLSFDDDTHYSGDVDGGVQGFFDLNTLVVGWGVNFLKSFISP